MKAGRAHEGERGPGARKRRPALYTGRGIFMRIHEPGSAMPVTIGLCGMWRISDGRHASPDRVRAWVLLVECEPLARDAIAEALGEVASNVIKATDVDAALRAAEADPGVPPTVLVTRTDFRAGAMDGLALAGEARRRWPDLGVVYVTERPSRLDGHVLGARDRFLPRPVAPRALMRTVRGLLALPAHRAG